MPKGWPSLNPDTGAVLFLIFSNHGQYFLYTMQFKIPTKSVSISRVDLAQNFESRIQQAKEPIAV